MYEDQNLLQAPRTTRPGFIPVDAEPPDFVPLLWTKKGKVEVHPAGDGSIEVLFWLGRADGGHGQLRVWHENATGRVERVQLSLPDGLRPTDLSTFSWSKWLSVADAGRALFSSSTPIAGSFDSEENKRLTLSVENARAGRRPSRGTAGSRPGRKGHPDRFYAKVADRYVLHRMKGARNPTQLIAEDMKVTRSTAAGWVRGARKRGFLDPARHGKAG